MTNPTPGQLALARRCVADQFTDDTRESKLTRLTTLNGGNDGSIPVQAALAAITATERAADAFLVEWQRAGETWVQAHADEPTAVDQARKMGGTCTPLYRRPPQSGASEK